MTAWVASAPFTRSSSNHSSRRSAALIENSRTSSAMSPPVQRRNLPASASHRGRSRRLRFGGTTNSISFSSGAIRAKYRSNSTKASASRFENLAMFAASRCRSPQSVSELPSGKGAK